MVCLYFLLKSSSYQYRVDGHWCCFLVHTFMEPCSLFIFQYIHSQISWHTMKIDILMQKQKPYPILAKKIILDVCKPLKFFLKIFYDGLRRYSHLSSFGIAWTGRINLKKKLGYNIKYLSIWAFMRYPCFLTEKVSKVTFILICQKNSHGLFRGYFSGKRG